MVDRLVAVNDVDYRLPEPVLGALASDMGSNDTGIGSALSANVIANDNLGVPLAKVTDRTLGMSNILTNGDWSQDLTGWAVWSGVLATLSPDAGRGDRQGAVVAPGVGMMTPDVYSTPGTEFRIEVVYRTIGTGSARDAVRLQSRHASGSTAYLTLGQTLPETSGQFASWSAVGTLPAGHNRIRAWVGNTTGGLTYHVESITIRPTLTIAQRLGGANAVANAEQAAPNRWIMSAEPVLKTADMIANLGFPAGTGLGPIYWPCVVDMQGVLTAPLGRYYMYWSTDHHPGSGAISMAYANDPKGPWTVVSGPVYIDTTPLSNSTETPWIIARGTNDLIMYYQQRNYELIGGGPSTRQTTQQTLYATSTDGVNWTRGAVVLDYPETLGGAYHTGYFRCYPLLTGGYVGYSVVNGGSYSRIALWYSRNGIDWKMDRRTFVRSADISASGDSQIDMKLSLFEWHGDIWAAFDNNAKRVSKVRADFLGFEGPMYPILQSGYYPQTVVTGPDGNLYGFWENDIDNGDGTYGGGIYLGVLEV